MVQTLKTAGGQVLHNAQRACSADAEPKTVLSQRVFCCNRCHIRRWQHLALAWRMRPSSLLLVVVVILQPVYYAHSLDGQRNSHFGILNSLLLLWRLYTLVVPASRTGSPFVADSKCKCICCDAQPHTIGRTISCIRSCSAVHSRQSLCAAQHHMCWNLFQ